VAGAAACQAKLQSCEGRAGTSSVRILADAWSLLADCQSALTHTCMVAFTSAKSAKLDFLFEGFGSLVQLLQTKCEKEWTTPSGAIEVPEMEAKQLMRSVRTRLRDFILAVQAEICTNSSGSNSSSFTATAGTTAAAGAGISSAFGQQPIFSGSAIAQQAASDAASTDTTESSTKRAASAAAGPNGTSKTEQVGSEHWIGLGSLGFSVSPISAAPKFTMASEASSTQAAQPAFAAGKGPIPQKKVVLRKQSRR
jgi:hypothetical protein